MPKIQKYPAYLRATVTRGMWERVARAATEDGDRSVSSWLRLAVEEKLERDEKGKQKKGWRS